MSSDQDVPVLPPVDPQNMAMLQGIGALLNGKQIPEYSIPEQRQIFRKFQSTQAQHPGIEIQRIKINTSFGEVETFVYKPKTSTSNTPFVYFIHGGGWILGSVCDWEEFLFDLVERTQLAVVFPEYTLAPEKKYPAQQEQCIEVLQHVLNNGEDFGVKTDKIVLACDSVGGKEARLIAFSLAKVNVLPAQLTSAVSILNRKRSLGLQISHQIWLHPFVHTASTAKLIDMPLADPAWTEQSYAAYFEKATERSDILASPDLMTSEQLKEFMPPTTVSS